MFDFIREHQLNIMLVLCGVCIMTVFLLLITRFLSKQRRTILVFMELIAFFLLLFDRSAYIYAGDTSLTGFIMVRLSNFMVFFLTSAVVLGLNLYLIDWMKNEGENTNIPYRLNAGCALATVGMLMAALAACTNLYYYFDETNTYHRGNGFLIAYIIPVVCPVLTFTVLIQYRKIFSKLIFISLLLYMVVPIACGILQIFTYGISIVNISMVMVSITMYIFTYLDMNNTVIAAHETEIERIQRERNKMHRLFDQTAKAFVSAVEKKDDFTKGNSMKTAEYARLIAKTAGKSDDECDKIYYAALLHDVGIIGVPDAVIKNESDPQKWDYEIMHQKPMIGRDILSSITEYPYLSIGAAYSHERYNGTGYPSGLKGDDIPEIARIIAVADAYVTMTTPKRYREARPAFIARETFVKDTGESFDPVFADIMVKIIDSEGKDLADEIHHELEKEIVCNDYREYVTNGVSIENNIKKISFEYEETTDNGFSSPAVVLFDSYDGRVHNDKRSIEGYHYIEYGEIWFDKHSVTTAARRIEEKLTGKIDDFHNSGKTSSFEVLAGRFEDHIKLVMKAGDFSKEVIIALPGGSKKVYLCLTGENCRLYDISEESTDRITAQTDIPRIANPVSFLDHLEADIPNVQVDRFRSAYTDSIEIKGRIKMSVHSMSLPGADLVWNCPYIVLFTSDDGRINGENYREYTLIKFNGENESTEEFASNRFIMKRHDSFTGWSKWKTKNSHGMEYEFMVERKGDHVTFKTENMGIYIENITSLSDKTTPVYMALTGDQVALTDIRYM